MFAYSLNEKFQDLPPLISRDLPLIILLIPALKPLIKRDLALIFLLQHTDEASISVPLATVFARRL